MRIVDQTSKGARCYSKDYCLTYFLSDLPGKIDADATPEQRLRSSRGTFTFYPPGMPLGDNVSPSRRIQIRQSHQTYARLAALLGLSLPETAQYGLDDPLVSQIVLTIAKDMDQRHLDYILADALNTVLAVRIVWLCSDLTSSPRTRSNSLSRQRLMRVCDHIEAHLGGRLTLRDLAPIAGISIYYFSRSFKQAVGVGPQRYVTRKRLERAKRLLLRTAQPLALIARQVGFADESHLISVFRREIGMTPGRFRAKAL